MKIGGIEVSGFKYSNALSQFAVEHVDRMAKHYAHAIEKHPYFCDIITCLSDVGSDTHLDIYRATLRAESKNKAVEVGTLIGCEFYEAIQAYAHGDIVHAVEELYDMVAVCLRTIDVLEGRQKLGKPEEVEK